MTSAFGFLEMLESEGVELSLHDGRISARSDQLTAEIRGFIADNRPAIVAELARRERVVVEVTDAITVDDDGVWWVGGITWREYVERLDEAPDSLGLNSEMGAAVRRLLAAVERHVAARIAACAEGRGSTVLRALKAAEHRKNTPGISHSTDLGHHDA